MKTTANQRCNRNIPATANQWCHRNIIPAGFTLHHSPSEFPRWCNNTMKSIPIHPKHHKTHTYRITHVHTQTHTDILVGSWVHTHTFSQDPGCINILTVHGQIFSQDHTHKHTNIFAGSQIFSQDHGCTHPHIHPSGLWLVNNLAFYAQSTNTVILGQTQDCGCTHTHADCEKGHTCMSNKGHTYCWKGQQRMERNNGEYTFTLASAPILCVGWCQWSPTPSSGK